MNICGSIYWGVNRNVGGELVSSDVGVGWDVGRDVVAKFFRDLGGGVVSGYGIDIDISGVFVSGDGEEVELYVWY